MIWADFSMTKKQKHLETKSSTCIVVGPMPFARKDIDPTLKDTSIELVFIDGGAAHEKKFGKLIKKHHLTPQHYGDGDSSLKLMNHKKHDQNISDLAYFLQNALLKKNIQKYDRYIFLGFLGGRIDHELINLGEFFRFMKHFKSVSAPKVFIEDKIEFFASGSTEVFIEGIFSVASFEKSKFKIGGECLYKTKSAIELQGLSSRGLSNVGKGVVKIESTTPIAVFKNKN